MTRLPPLFDPRELLIFGCNEIGVSINVDAADKMMRYLDLLREWNAKVNLTAISEPSEIVITHFLDSLTVFKSIERGIGLRVLDIGTGAGFPGIVLRIMDPSLDLTLLDRNPKKMVFLKYVAQALDLQGVKFLNLNLENLLDSGVFSPCDVVVSRAFSSDPVLWDRLSVLLRSGGYLVRMAGPAALTEELQLPHFRLASFWEGNLPFSTKFRRVMCYQRIA